MGLHLLEGGREHAKRDALLVGRFSLLTAEDNKHDSPSCRPSDVISGESVLVLQEDVE